MAQPWPWRLNRVAVDCNEQAVFLELVNAHNGVAFVARNANDVYKNLKGSIYESD